MERRTSSLRRSADIASLISWFLLSALAAAPAQDSTHASPTSADVRMVFSHSLPKLEEESLKVTVVQVTYGPGGSSPPHSHPCPVVGYVVEGALRMKVKGEPEKIYKAGESFYEAPNRIHEVSANGSQTRPARFLAYFVCDRDVPLSVTEATAQEGKKP